MTYEFDGTRITASIDWDYNCYERLTITDCQHGCRIYWFKSLDSASKEITGATECEESKWFADRIVWMVRKLSVRHGLAK